MLQLNSVDSEHFTQLELSIGWSDVRPRLQALPPQYKLRPPYYTDHFGRSPKVIFISRFDCIRTMVQFYMLQLDYVLRPRGRQSNMAATTMSESHL